MKFSAARITQSLGILAAAAAVVWIGYGLSLPEDYESITTGFVKRGQLPADPDVLVTRPDAWPKYFPFIQKTERVTRPLGEPPHYRVKENAFIHYLVRQKELSDSKKMIWEVAESPAAEGSFLEVLIDNKDSGSEVQIKEHVKITSPFLRTYYQVFRGYQTHHEVFEKLFKSLEEASK